VKPLEDLPNSFWSLMSKGEKSQLKLEGLAQFFFLFLFCLKQMNGASLFVNMICLEKQYSPVFQTGCSIFSLC
jgi:hypothetical protein